MSMSVSMEKFQYRIISSQGSATALFSIDLLFEICGQGCKFEKEKQTDCKEEVILSSIRDNFAS